MPSLNEYMAVTVPSFGLGPITFTSFCLLGPELSEEVVRSREYGEMIRCVATCSRFLNDLRTYEREEEQGKTNSVLLLAPRYGGSIEAAKREARSALAASRRELLRMVVRDGGAVPGRCGRSSGTFTRFRTLCTARRMASRRPAERRCARRMRWCTSRWPGG